MSLVLEAFMQLVFLVQSCFQVAPSHNQPLFWVTAVLAEDWDRPSLPCTHLDNLTETRDAGSRSIIVIILQLV
jgi:hypothetical protein